ncbi:hypothetical protein DRQ53_02800 [bacterium]|nr:MAG: hypothetical protein DRQ32_09170 [bacterium]RKZ17657.1 MAG: hypothetical protein DRQ53_02800 [bacterium]
MNGQTTIVRLLRGQRGFTAIELLVSVVLSAVVGIIIFSVFFSSRDSYVDTRNVAITQSDSRNLMSLLAQDLRSAGSNPRRVGTVQRLPVANGFVVRIQSDSDGNGMVNAAGEPAEDVTWAFDAVAESITRTTPEGTTTLLTNVTALQFVYLDAGGNVLGPLPLTPEDRDLVRAVDVALSVRILDDATRTWNTVLALRNDP